MKPDFYLFHLIVVYYEDGFLTLQHALHQSVINEITNNKIATNVSNFETLMQRFPYPPYVNDLFLVAIQTNFPFFIMLCMIFYSLSIPKEVTLEKERKLKVGLKSKLVNLKINFLLV